MLIACGDSRFSPLSAGTPGQYTKAGIASYRQVTKPLAGRDGSDAGACGC